MPIPPTSKAAPARRQPGTKAARQELASGVQQSAGKSTKVTLVPQAKSRWRPEASSSGGQRPAGTAAAENLQAEVKAEPSEASVLKKGSYSAADLVGRGFTAADVKRPLRYSKPVSVKKEGITNPKRPNHCSGDSQPADASGQTASKRRRTDDHEDADYEDTSGSRCRALVVERGYT